MTIFAPTRPPSVLWGWIVTLAGLGINLALGSLYTWSVISKAIPQEWGWTEAQKSLPYSVAVLVFSLMMVPGGRLQDQFGPRLVATIGGLLLGIGFIAASLTTQSWGYVLGFGLLVGSGIGFSYSACTPAAVKWFPASKTGMIAGIVVSGFGLAAVYASPLAQGLISLVGVQQTMFYLGLGFLVVVVLLAQLLRVPPQAGYGPGLTAAAGNPAPAVEKKMASPGDLPPMIRPDYSPIEVLRTWQFYVLWLMYAVGAGAGLMVISKLAPLAKTQAGLELGFLLVAALALGNGIGRIITGTLSDRIGRRPTLLLCFVLQLVLMLLLTLAKPGTVLATTPVMAVLSALIGANFGANLALFPALTKDYYGLKHFGVNYGLMFTAYGVGGFSLSLLAGALYDAYQTYTVSCYVSAGLLALAALLTLAATPPFKRTPPFLPETK